jgi:DNA-directed RNA polymerase subunit M/transcription elongation factor TFIIS
MLLEGLKGIKAGGETISAKGRQWQCSRCLRAIEAEMREIDEYLHKQSVKREEEREIKEARARVQGTR